MSVAQSLPEIDKNFMQICPLCKQDNRMIIKGVKHYDERREIYPDIGYSFCNCKNIFYTNHENLWQHGNMPICTPDELKRVYEGMKSGKTFHLIMPDPFFIEWAKDPHEYLHWDPRKNYIIWDMEQFVREIKAVGFEVLEYFRDFGIESDPSQVFKVKVKKP